MTSTYESGTTIRVRATWREWRAEGDTTPADVVDPDEVSVLVTNASHKTLVSLPNGHADIFKVTSPPSDYPDRDVPYYYYDWTLPPPGTYFIIFTGMIDDKPVLIRHKVKTKWDVA
jgi:hypothetical protein